MKKLPQLLALLFAWCLLSCNHPITLETTVREDGSFTKTIIFEKTDSSVLRGNIFGVSEQNGWKVTAQTIGEKEEKDRFRIKFEKGFASANELNAELDSESDTLFRIRSSWEEQRRWFYTYFRYEETLRVINRFKLSPPENFFNEEDRLFISRLPSEGSSLSKPDSIFLANLDKKISDHYVVWAIFNEQMDILKKLVLRSGLEPRWLDTLKKHEDIVHRSIEDDKGDEQFQIRMANLMGIPLPKEAGRWADSLSADFNSRLRFMADAYDARFQVLVELPWAVVASNADSVAGNRAFWRPRPHKFALSDYTLFAEVRRPNIIVVVVSLILLAIGLFVLLRKTFRQGRT